MAQMPDADPMSWVGWKFTDTEEGGAKSDFVITNVDPNAPDPEDESKYRWAPPPPLRSVSPPFLPPLGGRKGGVQGVGGSVQSCCVVCCPWLRAFYAPGVGRSGTVSRHTH